MLTMCIGSVPGDKVKGFMAGLPNGLSIAEDGQRL